MRWTMRRATRTCPAVDADAAAEIAAIELGTNSSWPTLWLCSPIYSNTAAAAVVVVVVAAAVAADYKRLFSVAAAAVAVVVAAAAAETEEAMMLK